MTSGAPRVLIVDDEPAVRAVVIATLEMAGFEIAGQAGTGDEALRLLDELDAAPAAIVVDQRMPGLSGVETAELILSVSPNQILVLFSAALDDETVTRALQVGVLQCVDKLEVNRLAPVLHTLLGTQKWMRKRHDGEVARRTPPRDSPRGSVHRGE